MSKRVSILTSRHIALGAKPGQGEGVGYAEWNGMNVAWNYASNPEDEHDAVRQVAGLFDVSALRKIRVRGADALSVVDHVSTRDMTKIYPGKSGYGLVLTEQGTICDDCIIANLGDDGYLMVIGSGEGLERLQESAEGKDVTVELDDELHDISLQGPKAVDFLNEHTPLDLPSLKYFHQEKTILFDQECVISRTGYSGERGYEIFANSNEVQIIWDTILEKGKNIGIVPCSFTCLDKIRIEASLLFYPYDMTKENSPWEVGLGWAFSKAGNYRGKAAAESLRGKERINFAGIYADHNEALAGGEILLLEGKEVGVVNSPAYSHRMKKSLALVHLSPEASEIGTKLRVKGDGIDCTATVGLTPFYDPDKTRTHA